MVLGPMASEAQFLFEIAGKELAVMAFTAREEISSPFQVDLTLASEDDIKFDAVISKEALLTISGNGVDRYFHGIINEFMQSGNQGRFHLYQATMVPSLWLLSLEQDCRIFQNKSVQDIVKQILEEAGITSDRFEFRLQNPPQPREYCVQYRETDFNFISRLLEEEGIFYFFEHGKDKHLLVFGDGTINYQPIQGEASVVFRPADAMVPEEEFVNSFVLSRQIRSGKSTLQDFNFQKPSLDLTSQKEASSFPKLEIYDYPGEYLEQDRGKKLADIRLQEAVTFTDSADANSVCPRLTPGFTFKLADHERENFNQEYLLLEVMHNGSQPQVLEEHAGTGGASYSNQFLCIPASVTFRPVRNTPKPVVEGVQTAIVTGPGGEEIYTDEHGRVKVQFHWDREGKRDEKSSCWIRVSQVWAGAGWGAMYIPRIDQEVIVDFIEGDPDRPIITGRVYHGTNKPPYTLPEDKTKSTIKSDSSIGGGGSNEFRFEDKKGEEEIFLHAQKDQVVVVENDRAESTGNDRSLQVGRDKSETVGRNKSIQVAENHTENVGSAMNIMVGSTLTETVGVNYAETVGGAMELSVGAALAITVGAAMAETVGGAKAESIGAAKAETIGAQKSLTIGKNLSENIGKNRDVEIGANLKEKVGGQHREEVDKEYMLQAKKIQLVAKEEVNIKTGKAEIVMKKNGNITIKGKKITVKGSGDVILKGSKIKEN
jgi:type VI secretion system secreted protein VgrG